MLFLLLSAFQQEKCENPAFDPASNCTQCLDIFADPAQNCYKCLPGCEFIKYQNSSVCRPLYIVRKSNLISAISGGIYSVVFVACLSYSAVVCWRDNKRRPRAQAAAPAAAGAQ